MVGCDFTTASRLRNGTRLPSREMLERIIEAYDLDPREALEATANRTFGSFLKRYVFELEAEETRQV